MVHGVAQNIFADPRIDGLAAIEQLPRQPEVRVGCPLERRTQLTDIVIEFAQQRRRCLEGVAGTCCQVEIDALDDLRHHRRHPGDELRQMAERRRLRVRFPRTLAIWHPLEQRSRGPQLVAQLGHEVGGDGHGGLIGAVYLKMAWPDRLSSCYPCGSHLRSSRMAPCVSAPVAVTHGRRVNSGMSESSVGELPSERNVARGDAGRAEFAGRLAPPASDPHQQPVRRVAGQLRWVKGEGERLVPTLFF